MASTILISTDQVEQIASSIESLNNRLRDTLEESKSTILALSSTWMGEAASETTEAYEAFAQKYFQSYYDVIAAYVTFLRQNVSLDYQQTESANTSLAENFR